MDPIRLSHGRPARPSPLDAPRAWARGRLWWPRVPVLLWALWTWGHHLADPQWQGIAKGIDLGLHEAGHAIFGWFGEWPGVAGGSFFQCLCPGLALLVLHRQRDWFGMAFCLAWLGTNLFDVATYVADARAMDLPLVTPFGGDGEVIHDWNWMLDRLGWLERDQALARAFRGAGSLAFLGALAGGGWLVREMFRSREHLSG